MSSSLSTSSSSSDNSSFDTSTSISTQTSNSTSTGVTPWHISFGAATTGSMLTAVVVNPFEVVKTRMQNHVCEPACLETTSRELVHIENGTARAMKIIVRHEGMSALWRGIFPTLLMQVPAMGLYYSFYERLRDRPILRDSQHFGFFGPMIAGATARLIASSVVAPFEYVRTNLQAQVAPKYSNHITLPKGTTHYNGAWDVVRQAVSSSRGSGVGVAKLWSGLGPTLWRDIPFSAVYWMCFENGRKFVINCMTQQNEVNERRRTDSSNSARSTSCSSGPGRRRSTQEEVVVEPTTRQKLCASLVSGLVSGSVAALVTTPADVVKTQMQTSATKASQSTGRQRLKRILRQEGVYGLFRGVGPRLMKVAPSCALMITTYDAVRMWLLQDTTTVANHNSNRDLA